MVHMNFYPGLNSLWEGVTVQMKKPIFNQNGLFFFVFTKTIVLKLLVNRKLVSSGY